MRSRILARRSERVEVSVEEDTSTDVDGAPSYGTAETIEARAVRETKVIRTGQGLEIQTRLTLYVPGGESPMPDEHWRITHDGETYIVAERRDGRRIDNTLDHVRLRCRYE